MMKVQEKKTRNKPLLLKSVLKRLVGDAETIFLARVILTLNGAF